MQHRSSLLATPCTGWLRSAPWVLRLSALLVGLGCSDDPIDLGRGIIQPPGDGVDEMVADRSALSAYAATWNGYLETFSFDSGSANVRLEIDAAGTGEFVFGEGDAPPLPNDPDNPFNEAIPGAQSPQNFMRLIEGASYAFSGAIVEAERLRAQTDTRLYVDAACALQEPIPPSEPNGQWRCLPNVASRKIDDACFLADAASPTGPSYPHPVSCAKRELCRICACTQDGCSARTFGTEIVFDAAFEGDDGDILIGTVLGSNVRLERQAPGEW